MSKSLCKFRRTEIVGQIQQIQSMVEAPKYVCKSCARVANRASFLCKPMEMDLKAQSSETVSDVQKKALKAQKKRNKKLKKLLKEQKKLLKKQDKLVEKIERSKYSLSSKVH
ncbi:hypothetical protein [Vibrio viridaestus]|nr:hypothetical protein [Vibrio viridaestus]